MVEYTTLDTEVENLRDDAGIEESVLLEADEPVEVVLGRHVNGNDVSVDAQHFAAITIDRELGEEEQAVHGQETLVFSSVLLAAEDGEASQETLVNVRDGGIDEAISALERVTEDGRIDALESSAIDFQADEDGDVVEVEQAELEEE